MTMKEEFTAIDMATAAADGFRNGQKAAQSAGVPDGWKLVPIKPTIEMVEAGFEEGMGMPDRSAHARVIEQYDAMLAAAPSAPTVKAEQVQCADPCGLDHAQAFNAAPTEALRPSLPAAGSADLTAVRCQCCATEYPHDSYDAGFIAGSGMCQVCDAAMPPKDLPAAGSADLPPPDFALDGGSQPCYYAETVQRIVAALSAQQSAHVSVPMGVPEARVTGAWESARIGDFNAGWNACRNSVLTLLNKAAYMELDTTKRSIAIQDEVRALLNGGEA
ncbi:hypothetical protein ACNJYG_06850 [Pseudomonas sp. GW6]